MNFGWLEQRGSSVGGLTIVAVATIAVAALAAGIAAWPAEASGSTGLAFLKIGVDARAVAVGHAMASHVDDASAHYWNPAGLAALEGGQLVLVHNESFQGIRQEFAALARNYGRFALAAGFQGVWTENLTGFDVNGDETGTFGYYDLATGVSAGLQLNSDLAVGATMRYLREDISDFATDGIAFDAGFQWRAPNLPFTVGAVVQNLGPSLSLDEQSFDLPLAVQGGCSCGLNIQPLAARWLLAVELRKVRDEDLSVLVGSEYTYRGMLSIGAGYRSSIETEDVSFGIGLAQGRLRADYAYVPFGDELGDQQRISLRFSF